MSTASTMVTEIDTAISDIVTNKVDSVTIDGESFNSLNLDALRQLRTYYANIAAGDTAIATGSAPFGITGLSAGSGR